jgi:hypothetical protein
MELGRVPNSTTFFPSDELHPPEDVTLLLLLVVPR